MNVITITCEHTRQVRQYEPVRFSMTAQINEGEDPIKCAIELQRIVLMATYKDSPSELKMLLEKLTNLPLPDKKIPGDAPKF